MSKVLLFCINSGPDMTFTGGIQTDIVAAALDRARADALSQPDGAGDAGAGDEEAEEIRLTRGPNRLQTGVYEVTVGARRWLEGTLQPASFSSREQPQLRDVAISHDNGSISFTEGGVVAILSRSGGGKTTVARGIAALLHSAGATYVRFAEPERGSNPGLSAAYSAFFSQLANSERRIVVIDSLAPLSLFGASLGEGGVSRDLYGMIFELNRLCKARGHLLFVVANPLLKVEKLESVQAALFGASMGFFFLETRPSFDQTVRIPLSYQLRPERSVKTATLELSAARLRAIESTDVPFAELIIPQIDNLLL